MDSIYIVEADFDDYECSWVVKIGLFTSKNEAELSKSKWEEFFISNKSIFNEPDNWEPDENDKEFGDDEWTQCGEYYDLLSKYGDINKYNGIRITKLPINKDIFLDYKFLTTPMNDIITQFERDYKLKKIL